MSNMSKTSKIYEIRLSSKHLKCIMLVGENGKTGFTILVTLFKAYRLPSCEPIKIVPSATARDEVILPPTRIDEEIKACCTKTEMVEDLLTKEMQKDEDMISYLGQLHPIHFHCQAKGISGMGC